MKYVKKTWRVSLSIGVRITMICCVVYLLRIFKMFHGLMKKLVFLFLKILPFMRYGGKCGTAGQGADNNKTQRK